MPSSKNNHISSFTPAGAVTIPSEGPSNSRRGYGRGARSRPPNGNGPERYRHNILRGYVKWRASARRGSASNNRGRGGHHFEHAYPPHQTHHSPTQEDNTTRNSHQGPNQSDGHLHLTNNPRLGFARTHTTNPRIRKRRGVDRDGDCHMTGTPFIYPRKLWIQMQREIEEEEATLKRSQIQRQLGLANQLDQIINEERIDNPLHNGFAIQPNNGFNPLNNGFNPLNNGFRIQTNNGFNPLNNGGINNPLNANFSTQFSNPPFANPLNNGGSNNPLN